METEKVRIEINPQIPPDQLFSFYVKNDVCETVFGKETASRVLDHTSLIVAAFEGDELVGFARAMFDGLAAVIMEFCVALKYQGDNLRYKNGSLVEKDSSGLGKEIGTVLVNELIKMGATFISYSIVADCEEEFYESLGFEHNTGHLVYMMEMRPYVTGKRPEAFLKKG